MTRGMVTLFLQCLSTCGRQAWPSTWGRRWGRCVCWSRPGHLSIPSTPRTWTLEVCGAFWSLSFSQVSR